MMLMFLYLGFLLFVTTSFFEKKDYKISIFNFCSIILTIPIGGLTMIDIHCHILYGVDDSIKTPEDTLAMLKMACEDGIQIVCATSHVHYKYPNQKQKLHKCCNEVKKLIEKENLAITLIESSELFLSQDTKEFLDEPYFSPYENSRHVLVEFPWKPEDGNGDVDALLEQLIARNYIPVIAHPERYEQVFHDFSLVYKWKKMGCLLQVNRTSILGLDKLSYAQELAIKLMDEGIADVIASDSHGPYGKRYPILSDVYAYVAHRYGEQRANQYFYEVPKQILNL